MLDVEFSYVWKSYSSQILVPCEEAGSFSDILTPTCTKLPRLLLVSPASRTRVSACLVASRRVASVLHSSASLGRSQAGGTEGFKFFEVDELERLMRDAGFADVKARHFLEKHTPPWCSCVLVFFPPLRSFSTNAPLAWAASLTSIYLLVVRFSLLDFIEFLPPPDIFRVAFYRLPPHTHTSSGCRT